MSQGSPTICDVSRLTKPILLNPSSQVDYFFEIMGSQVYAKSLNDLV